jgi:dCTP deaminase
MIKSDNWIIKNGKKLFDKFNIEQVNSASYDLKLDNRFVDLRTGEEICADEITINPGDAYLASTWEYVRLPDYIAGAVFLKSSMARLGLDHALAGWVDPGFEGNLTLELHSHRLITLLAGQRTVQIVFYGLDEAAEHPYNGKYKGQVGPTKAK